METQEQCDRKGREIPIVKHVVDLAFPDGNNVPFGDPQKKGIEFTSLLFPEGWNLVFVVSKIHEFLCGVPAFLHLYILSS